MPEVKQLPTTERLHELVDSMQGRPVLMLVDLVADRFITGSPKRISREAPVLILSWEDERFVPGGGANAVANVAALGGRPLPVGIVGADANGRALIGAFEELGVTTQGIFERSGYRTPAKTRILAGSAHSMKQQIVRLDREERASLSAGELQWLEETLAGFKGEAQIAVLSDYGYGTVEPALLPVVRANLRPKSVVLCDSRHRLADFQGIDGATPNEEETGGLAGTPLGDGTDHLEYVGDSVRRDLDAQFLLITRGSKGMSLFEDDTVCHIPIHGSEQVADVTGAGDTVIGTLSLALAAGAAPLEAALLANYAGGIVVGKLGTATLSPDELKAGIGADSRPLREMEWARS